LGCFFADDDVLADSTHTSCISPGRERVKGVDHEIGKHLYLLTYHFSLVYRNIAVTGHRESLAGYAEQVARIVQTRALA
jgi:hypothetical protein